MSEQERGRPREDDAGGGLAVALAEFGRVPFVVFGVVLVVLLAVGSLVSGLSTVAGVLASLVTVAGVAAFLAGYPDSWP